jgi:hypothetical protein
LHQRRGDEIRALGARELPERAAECASSYCEERSDEAIQSI